MPSQRRLLLYGRSVQRVSSKKFSAISIIVDLSDLFNSKSSWYFLWAITRLRICWSQLYLQEQADLNFGRSHRLSGERNMSVFYYASHMCSHKFSNIYEFALSHLSFFADLLELYWCEKLHDARSEKTSRSKMCAYLRDSLGMPQDVPDSPN